MKAPERYPLGMPPGVLRTLLLRLSMLLIFGASAALIWWSVHRLQPLEKRIEERTGHIAAAENEILRMELRWNPDDAKVTESRFKQAAAQLFSSADDFTRWQEELKRSQADLFRMAFVVHVGQTQASPLPNKVFATTTATIELQSAADNPALISPYQRLVELLQTITTHTKRVDLLELSASGNSNSISSAKLRVQVWSQEEMASSR